MKRISLRLAIAILTFVIGVTAAALWTAGHHGSTNVPEKPTDCNPKYSPIPDSKNEEGWNSILDRFQEVRFEELPVCVDESYRFIWIPSFHAPISVRIWRSGEEQFLVATKLDGRGGYGMGQLALQESRSLSDDQWNEFIRLLRESGYWDMPSVDNSPPPEDGAEWIIEGLRNGKHLQVSRRSPSAEFRAACIYLVKLSGLRTEIERY